MFNIIKKTYIWLAITVLGIFIGSFLFFSNMRLSIDFTGGLDMKIDNTDISKEKLTEDLESFVTSFEYEYQNEKGESEIINIEDYDLSVDINENEGYTSMLLAIPMDRDAMVKALSEDLEEFLIQQGYIENLESIMETSIIGPSIGDYMTSTAIKALGLGIVFMGIYILLVFSSLRDVLNPVLLAVVTTITLIFDVLIAAGSYGALMYISPTLQVDVIFVIALLTVMGYSVNDTIVIFDRIRENYKMSEGALKSGKKTYGEIFEKSLWDTMRRSLGTSISTLIVLIAMYVFGTGMLQTFSFIVAMGVLAGTYSSIFVAAPLAYMISGKYHKEQR